MQKKEGGKCLSKEYVNTKTKMNWECKEGHIWKTAFGSMKCQNSWCLECGKISSANKRRGSIEECHNIAKERGGKCLSKEYVNTNTKMNWECKEGHIWKTAFGSMKCQNSWCLECGKISSANKRRGSIEECHNIAKERGGKCLSKEYVNTNTKMNWECKKGHIWEAAFGHIKHSKSWCPTCSYKINSDKMRGSIEECHNIAKEKKGKCLSNTYTNANTKMKWECKEGHIWTTSLGSIKFGSWCPICCRKIIADKLKSSIEECHNIAKEKGGKCLSKEYINTNTKMKWECKEGHTLETTFGQMKYRKHWCSICSGHIKLTLYDCQKYAEEKGGKCLSDKYINSTILMKWRCNKNHKFDRSFHTMRQHNLYCPICLLCPSCELWRTSGKLCEYCKPKTKKQPISKNKRI